MATSEKKKTARPTVAAVKEDVQRVEEKLDTLINLLQWQFKTDFKEGFHGAWRKLRDTGLIKED